MTDTPEDDEGVCQDCKCCRTWREQILFMFSWGPWDHREVSADTGLPTEDGKVAADEASEEEKWGFCEVALSLIAKLVSDCGKNGAYGD